MLSHRFKAIFKREVKQQIFSKRFLFMTISMPLIFLIMFGVQFLLVAFEDQEHSVLYVLTESQQMQTLFENQAADSDFADTELFELNYEQVDAGGIDAWVEAHREALLKGQITGALVLPDNARVDKAVQYYSSNPGNQSLQARMREVVNRAVVGEYFRNRNLDEEVVAYARSNVNLDGVRITEEGNEETGFGNLAVAFIFTFLMYISLLTMGPLVMGAVNEEKTNRVVEILLSSVTPSELMAGKIMGTAVSGLAQMIIWLSPMLVVGLFSLPGLAISGLLDFSISGGQVAYFLVNYLLGILIFMSIFAAFGAMFDTPHDAQSSMMPVMMLIIIPFVMTFTMIRNPASSLAEIFSMMPFTNLMIMPARMALINVPLWQLLVATGVNAVTFWFAVKFGAKIYRTTILLTGKKPTFREMIKWIRYE